MKKSIFLEMEDCMLGLKDKKSQAIQLRRLERLLNKEFNKDFVITVTENKSNKFFGMNVSPNNLETLLFDILDGDKGNRMLYKEWSSMRRWNIEIDSILLYDKKLDASPSEILSILLHEMGHVMYSDTAMQRAIRTLKLGLLKFDIKYKTIVKTKPFSNLMLFPLYEAITATGFNKEKEELIADEFVTSLGYGVELQDIITKLIYTQGTSNIIKSEKEKDDDVQILVRWAVENIASLEYRRDKLRNAIQLEKSRTNSSVVLYIISRVELYIFGERKDAPFTIADVTKEQFLKESILNVLKESKTHDLVNIKSDVSTVLDVKIGAKKLGVKIPKKKLDKILDRDIDIIEADIADIDYPDDKIFILERIHDMLDEVEKHLALIELGCTDKVPQPKVKLEGFKNRLESLRNDVRHTVVPEKHYGLYIKYPKGYQG